MSSSSKSEIFVLSPVEVETLRRAAVDRGLPFDADRKVYARSDLEPYGLVREGYTRAELRERGYGCELVTCFDAKARAAERDLAVEAPFGHGVRKWQLPIDMMPMRVHKAIFEPGSVVDEHVHPAASDDAPGGSLRIVVSGSIAFRGDRYSAGDWFFVPNGTPYHFTTDPDVETVIFYKYAFFGFEEGNRFSHPHEIDAATPSQAVLMAAE